MTSSGNAPRLELGHFPPHAIGVGRRVDPMPEAEAPEGRQRAAAAEEVVAGDHVGHVFAREDDDVGARAVDEDLDRVGCRAAHPKAAPGSPGGGLRSTGGGLRGESLRFPTRA